MSTPIGHICRFHSQTTVAANQFVANTENAGPAKENSAVLAEAGGTKAGR